MRLDASGQCPGIVLGRSGNAEITFQQLNASTEENLVFSRRLLEEQGVAAADPIVVVTSDFHVQRALRIARKAGFGEVAGVGAGTPLYLRYNAWLREYFAAISGWVLREY
ncbi:YdcF family protein [Cupriavidus sp. TMH.W2]|uniref:YdcF family protein n=1 Tax=Cupriavidus sp. TMH.W2 TaxID=3434465 RepID=UPI003D7830FF